MLCGKRMNDKQISLTTLLKLSAGIHWLVKKKRFCFLEMVIVMTPFFYCKNLLHLSRCYTAVFEIPVCKTLSVTVLWVGYVIFSKKKDRECATTNGQWSVNVACFLLALFDFIFP